MRGQVRRQEGVQHIVERVQQSALYFFSPGLISLGDTQEIIHKNINVGQGTFGLDHLIVVGV